MAKDIMSGPDFAINAVRQSTSDSKMCLQCGGAVIWMSAREREDFVEDFMRHEMLRSTLGDKIGMASIIILLLLFLMEVLGQYLGWWEIGDRILPGSALPLFTALSL